ncbi:hypothetical protein GF402_05910 [Candidatus Fermentibacteria bacterium]|nr:hypothetical protein [Candidatus Fermentibacteria bacterium]
MSSVLIRLHSLGDVVLAEPAARYLAGMGTVHFMVRERYEAVVGRMASGVLPVPVADSTGPMGLRRMVREIRPDRIIDLQGNLTTYLATWPGKASHWSQNRTLRRRILRGSGESLPYRSEEFLRTAGGEGQAFPHLEAAPIEPGGEMTVGLVAGGRWPAKSLPPGVLSELGRILSDRLDCGLVVIGESSDAEEADSVAESLFDRKVTVVAGRDDVAGLLQRIESLDLLVSPDSGPAHLAYALGVPVVVVFTSTSPALGFWRSDYPGAYMAPGVECRPCHKHGGRVCREGSFRCKSELLPFMIAEKALDILERS